jgi:hypothetical protein
MNNFPFVHLIALLVGAIILFLIKKKFQKIRVTELVIVFVLYFILIALFTEPALNLIRKFISLIQL